MSTLSRTFYISPDEEILSIIGRLHSSDMLENIFVVPKRALLLQSVVNLRMLSREAEKTGKKVIIVTQDENGRRLAEKTGLSTRPYSEESFQEPDQVTMDPPRMERETHSGISSDELGSNTFFSAMSTTRIMERSRKRESAAASGPIPEKPTEPELPVAVEGNQLRVRNLSPVRQTALNSLREAGGGGAAPMPRPMSSRESVSERREMEESLPSRISSTEDRASFPRSEGSDGRLSKVFSSSSAPSRPMSQPAPSSGQKRPPEPKRRKPSGRRPNPTVRIGGKEKVWFAFFAIVSLAAIVGTTSFIFLPKAEIEIVPRSVSQNIEIEMTGKTGSDASKEARSVPVRIVEFEKEMMLTFDASGSSAGDGSKASGKIVIYNGYGSDPQPLVATTRFVTEDGKIFRLVKGISVPGMSGNEPGVVEAEVIADSNGEEYNIGASDFSIPGFSGSSKADKIYAKSTSRMIGGSSVGDSGTTAVSSADLDQAATETASGFRNDFSSFIEKDLNGQERFIPEMFDISVTEGPTAPRVGTVASSFEYAATFHGRAFVFSEDDIREALLPLLRSRASVADGYSETETNFRYEEGGADYDAGTFRFNVGAGALFVAPIDIGSIREDFLGKKRDSSEIEKVLVPHQEIKSITIELYPDWLFLPIPKDRDRVTVTTIKP
jgi:hypothetical protein